MHADSQLLFGLLALQNNLINRQQLLAAFDRWTQDQSQPFGQVLVNLGYITAVDYQQVESLVAQHLGTLAGAPVPGPAEPGSAEMTRDEVPGPNDGATVLPSATMPDGFDPHATVVGQFGRSGSVSRFQILRPHATGGLGQVSVALDTELHREVALKEIKEQRADDVQSRARFLLEAEITGSLEHPGIVPVYGLGIYGDGRPYYAMRFIRGGSLQEAIEQFHQQHENPATRDAGQRQLQLRQLLGRFIDVCYAIEYAHSRGVLHRDLKPGNVMLGSYGETLVVDWGLAKAQGRGSENFAGEAALHPASTSGSIATMMGAAIGTPQYMSPEQAEGQLDRLGPATDVYSLGATLYFLLTGRPPFNDADANVVLRKVRAGDFPSPRSVKRDVPRGLEAICLKAMARSPHERYGSARELANDIEHWLADEPVAAMPDSAFQRLARWSRRHKSWTRAAAVALLLVTIVSIAAGTMIDRSRRSESLARQEADRQRIEAEQGFLAARRAVDDFFTHVSENKLLDAPGLQPLRKDLLGTALAYYQDFIRKRANDPDVQSELAATYYRVGQIENSIGTKASALAAFENAMAIQRRLADEQPDAATPRFVLADTHNAIGAVHLERAELPAALAGFEEARRLRAELVRKYPRESQYLRKLANSHNNVAAVQARLDNPSAALAEYQKANETRAQLVSQYPGVAQYRRDLAQGRYNLGLFHLENENLEAALESYRQALESFQALVEIDSKSIAYQHELLLTQCAVAEAEVELKRMDAALVSYETARELAERLAQANPSLLELRAALGRVYLGLGRLKHSANENTQAVEWLRKSRAVHEQLVAEDPSTSRYVEGVATCLEELAAVERDEGRPDEAAALLLKRRELYPGNAAELYRTAAQLALTVASVKDAEALPTARALRQSLVEQTIDVLREAIAAGYQDFAALQQDADFTALREDSEFKRLAEVK